MKLWAYIVVVTAALGVPLGASAGDVAMLRNGFSIRHQRREVIGSVTRLYLASESGSKDAGYVDVPTADIDHFEPDLPPPAGPTHSSRNLPDVINAASNRHKLDPDLISSVIHAESGFNVKAVSPKGAQGLMQLMPQASAHLGVADPFDPSANVDGGTRYLRELLQRYNFDLIKALAAYNAGPQRVEQYHGVPPYYETQAYVARVVRDFNRKKLAERRAASLKASSYHQTPAQKLPTVKQAAISDPTQPASR
jgi:soluble lytic murein transglycosylase-like protein